MTPLDYVKAGAAAFLLSLAFFGGCSVQKNRDTAAINEAQAQTTALERKLDKEARDHAEWIVDQERKNSARLAEIDQKNTEVLQSAKKDYERTIADLRAGNLQLRKRFTCPVASPAQPAGGVDNAEERGGLQKEDGEFLVSESERADEVVRQLNAAIEVIEELLKPQK